VIEKYNRFASCVEELGLLEDVDAKPILDVSPVIVNVSSQSPDLPTGTRGRTNPRRAKIGPVDGQSAR
jgi:hypothetical protein